MNLYEYHNNPDELLEGKNRHLIVPELAFEYAAYTIKGPWPEGEAVIAMDGTYSYAYAVNVLKAPFPLGEPEIRKSQKLSDFYDDFLKSLKV